MSLRSNLIRLAHSHPELRKDLLPLLKKHAGTVILRRPSSIRITPQGVKEEPHGGYLLIGLMRLGLGDVEVLPFRFKAEVYPMAEGGYKVMSFAPVQAVSGTGAEKMLSVYRGALEEVLNSSQGEMLF